MGRSNIPLMNVPHLFNRIEGENEYLLRVLILSAIALILIIKLTWLLKTDYGLAMRATGNSEKMIRSYGVNTNLMKVAGLGLANALTALSGSLVSQLQQFADINMGIGIVIFGLGAVMIGEVMTGFFRLNSTVLKITGVIAGCLIFRMIIAFTIKSGADPNLMKLVTAAVVLIFVSIPQLKNRFIKQVN
jgi:putative ABC transport system permease protein